MNSIERVMRTFQGKPVDRVPTFSAGMEDRTFCDVLGLPMISHRFLKRLPITRFLMNKFPVVSMKYIFQPIVNIALRKRIKASYLLGFDAVWALYDGSFKILSPDLIARDMGICFTSTMVRESPAARILKHGPIGLTLIPLLIRHINFLKR